MIDDENIFNPGTDITKSGKRWDCFPQRPYPLPMSIYGNITYGLKIKGIHKKKVLDEKVEHYLRKVKLWDEVKERLHHPVSLFQSDNSSDFVSRGRLLILKLFLQMNPLQLLILYQVRQSNICLRI